VQLEGDRMVTEAFGVESRKKPPLRVSSED